jgi:hypothetical protein
MAIRLTAAVLLLALLNACASPRVVRLDTGHGAPLEYRPPSNKSVKVDANAFEEALTQLVLNAPLTLRPPQQGWLVRASYPGNAPDTRWQSLMSKSFGGICEPGQRKETCLSLLDDVMGLSKWDKLGVALGLSIDPLKESISKAVENTLAPQLFYTVIATGLITWAVLAANPEPVFTKAAAIVSALLLIYLGVETFLEVVDASRELKWASDRATTWEELEHASQRFANRVGPEVARVFVLAVTVVVSHGMTGGSAWLASRLSMLPSFSEAATAGAARFGINLANVGQVNSVAVVGSTIVISLPASAVAMAAREIGSGGSNRGDESSRDDAAAEQRLSSARSREFFDLDDAASAALGEQATVTGVIGDIGPIKNAGVRNDLKLLGYNPDEFRAVQYMVSGKSGNFIITVFESESGIFYGPHISSANY